MRPVQEPGWGKTTWVESIEFNLGGNGGSTSCALAILGTPVFLWSAVGQDSFGSEVLAKLRAAGVDVSRVERMAGSPTPVSVILVQPNGNRAILQRPGASREVFADGVELKAEDAAGVAYLHVANLFALQKFQAHAAKLLVRAHELGLRTSVDTGWDAQGLWMKTLCMCLPHTDLLFVNEEEARLLTGSGDPENAAEILRRGGARDVVVKLGAKGCLVKTASDRMMVRGFRIDAVDTTGAGDCFCAGFLAALRRGFDYRQAARFANAVGALSASSVGSVTGLRSFEETIAWTVNPVR